MADDLLKELLTSPLEEPSRRERRAARRRQAQGDERPGTEITPDGSGGRGERGGIPRVPLWWGLAAATLGAVIVIAGYAVASDDAPVPTTTATTTTTVAAGDDGSPSGLPEGYVAVGDRLGMRVERILARPDGVFVTVTTVIVNSLDPNDSTGYQGGLWTLILRDGRRITSTDESFDPLARGTLSVRFPADGYGAGEVAGLELDGIANRVTAPFSAESVSGFEVTPGADTAVRLTPDRFGLDTSLAISLDQFTVGSDEARLDWSLIGDTANASLTPSLTVVDAGGRSIDVPLHTQSTGFANFHPSIPGPILSDGGAIGFRMPDGTALPADGELQAVLEVDVTWVTYEPVVVSLEVGDASITEMSG